jgi:hypothetical protein
MKNYIKVDGEMRQTRLLLATLVDSYRIFKNENPECKVGFTKFTLLRPPQVILPDQSGCHVTCVCVYCENLKLMFIKFWNDGKFKEVLKLFVCDISKEECIFGNCETCCFSENAQSFISYISADFEEKEVTFKQWESTDRMSLITKTKSKDEFFKCVLVNIEAMKEHYFYFQSQSHYLKQMKLSLDKREALVLFDFAENYHFTIQNEPQAVYFNRRSCTVHTACIYYKENDFVKCHSFCVLSDDETHDVEFVLAVMRIAVNWLNNNAPEVLHVNYLTDGARSQYKNKYVMWILLHHDYIFDKHASWNFHATSHGKSSCDGAGATLKRLVRRASLQQADEDKIDTAEKVYTWAIENLTSMGCYFLSVATTRTLRGEFSPARSNTQLVTGISKYHGFEVSGNQLEMKKVSFSSIIQHKKMEINRTLAQNIGSKLRELIK